MAGSPICRLSITSPDHPNTNSPAPSNNPDREPLAPPRSGQTAELALAQPHVVRLEARPPNTEGAGEVTVRQLVRAAGCVVGRAALRVAFDELPNVIVVGGVTREHVGDVRGVTTRTP